MLHVQKLASNWNDGTIIGCGPVAVYEPMDPCRFVLRDLGDTYVVAMQVWPVSVSANSGVTPFYLSPDHFPKSRPSALLDAWARVSDRYRWLFNGEEYVMPDRSASLKSKSMLRTETTTLAQ